MKFFRKLRRCLPHVVLALMLCIDILQVMHNFNPSQRFLTSVPSIVLITSGTVLAIILCIVDIARDNRRR